MIVKEWRHISLRSDGEDRRSRRWFAIELTKLFLYHILSNVEYLNRAINPSGRIKNRQCVSRIFKIIFFTKKWRYIFWHIVWNVEIFKRVFNPCAGLRIGKVSPWSVMHAHHTVLWNYAYRWSTCRWIVCQNCNSQQSYLSIPYKLFLWNFVLKVICSLILFIAFIFGSRSTVVKYFLLGIYIHEVYCSEDVWI